MGAVVPAAALALALLDGRSARADSRLACVAASDEGQRLRAAHRLIAARAQFVACARPECPALVQEDCATWLADIDRNIPTVVVAATDAKGDDVVDAVVTVDGAPFLRKLDGSAVSIDPGPHEFCLTRPDGSSATVTRVIGQGSQNQSVAVQFPPPAPSAPQAAPRSVASAATPPEGAALPPASAERASSSRRAHHLAGVTLGSAGVVGIALGSVFGALTVAAWQDVTASCPTHAGCSPAALSDHDHAVTWGTVSDIGFIGGGVLLGVGAAVYFTAPKENGVALSLLPGGLMLGGSF